MGNWIRRGMRTSRQSSSNSDPADVEDLLEQVDGSKRYSVSKK